MKSFELFRTVSEPDVPTLRHITNVQQTSAMLGWNLGDTVTRHSTVVFYIDTSSTSSEESTTTINQLTGLTPGRTYRFYLVVTSFDKTARSPDYSVITREFSISSSVGLHVKIVGCRKSRFYCMYTRIVTIFRYRSRGQRSKQTGLGEVGHSMRQWMFIYATMVHTYIQCESKK